MSNIKSCTPSRQEILARNGLTSLARNLNARLLERLARPGLTRPCSDISRVNHGKPLPLPPTQVQIARSPLALDWD